MSKTLRAYITIYICILASLDANAKNMTSVFANTSVFTTRSDTSIAIDETRNRLPAIITDAKLLMSEVIISDFNRDTLEVAFLLSKIFELLMEADQIGVQELRHGGMSVEDKEEFDRFNRTFTDLYTHKLLTVQNIFLQAIRLAKLAECSTFVLL